MSLLDLVVAKVAELTAGLVFDDPQNTGSTIAARVEKGFLAPKRATEAQGEDFPFVVARTMRGKESQRDGKVVIRLVGGIHTNGDKDDGQDDVERLRDSLLSILARRGELTGHHLEPDADWFYGDPEDGVQPHPKYYCTVDLTFKRPPNSTNRR